MNFDIFTSFASFDAGVDPHIKEALKRNIANECIRRVYVLTESSERNIISSYPQLHNEKVYLVLRPERPSFEIMISEINRGFLEEETQLAALLNADISFSSKEDVTRIETLMGGLPGDKNALALTRYDKLSDGYAITLSTEMGLPNLISADVWVFDQPVNAVNDLYYAQGQMNCDKFFTYDLRASGYSLFNPCLDIKALHHEFTVKDRRYYTAVNDEQTTLDALQAHWKKSVRQGDGYCGIVRVKSTDLLAGYLPAPLRWSPDKRLFLCITANDEFRSVKTILTESKRLTDDRALEVCLLYERESMREELTAWLIECNGSRFSPLKVKSLEVVIENVLSGRSDGLNEALLVNDPQLWDSNVMDFTPAAFVLCRDGRQFPDQDTEREFAIKDIKHKFRINSVTKNLCQYVTRLFMADETTVVLWHKTDKVNQKLVSWLNRIYGRIF